MPPNARHLLGPVAEAYAREIVDIVDTPEQLYAAIEMLRPSMGHRTITAEIDKAMRAGVPPREAARRGVLLAVRDCMVRVMRGERMDANELREQSGLGAAVAGAALAAIIVSIIGAVVGAGLSIASIVLGEQARYESSMALQRQRAEARELPVSPTDLRAFAQRFAAETGRYDEARDRMIREISTIRPGRDHFIGDEESIFREAFTDAMQQRIELEMAESRAEHAKRWLTTSEVLSEGRSVPTRRAIAIGGLVAPLVAAGLVGLLYMSTKK